MTGPVLVHQFDRAVDWTVLAQRYYLMGFERLVRTKVEHEPLAARILPRASLKPRAIYLQNRALQALRLRSLHVGAGLAGRYLLRDGGEEIRFAIDARDSHPIYDPETLEWAHVFFKSNRWPSLEYDPKVRPIVTGSASLTWRGIEWLRARRAEPKDIGVSMIGNLWGGREHVARVYEALASVPGRNDVRALFPRQVRDAEIPPLIARLTAAGVICEQRVVPQRDFWSIAARSKIVVVRAGVHLAIPWRVVELLAAGTCIVMDSRPYPSWPVPLESGVHYVDCGVERPPDGSPAQLERYDRITETIQSLLADPARMQAIREGAAAYFDEHAAPERVAAYVLRSLREFRPGPRL